MSILTLLLIVSAFSQSYQHALKGKVGPSQNLTEPASGTKIIIAVDDLPDNSDNAAEKLLQDIKESEQEENNTPEKDVNKDEQTKNEDENKNESVNETQKDDDMNDVPGEDELTDTVDGATTDMSKRAVMNGWKRNFAWVCPRGYSFSRISSVYSKSYKDRQWSGECRKRMPSGYHSSGFWSVQYAYDNDYRGRMRAYCPPQSAMTGFAGAGFNSNYSDRRFKIYCTHIWHHKKVNCRWSGNINNYKGHAFLDVNCRTGYYLTGVYSYFHTGHRDRIWNFLMCQYRKI